MTLDDIVKIKYVDEGYMADYPPHLLSKDEMCAAFILAPEGSPTFFDSNYVCLNPDLEDVYAQLKSAISYHVSRYLDKIDPVEPPMWVYSYMLGETVCETSDPKDKHDILTAFACDNVSDEFDAQAQQFCYDVSKKFCQKLPKDERELVTDGKVQLLRPPTIFGEPHVIKSIRVGVAYEVR